MYLTVPYLSFDYQYLVIHFDRLSVRDCNYDIRDNSTVHLFIEQILCMSVYSDSFVIDVCASFILSVYRQYDLVSS